MSRPNYYIPEGLVTKKYDRSLNEGAGLFSLDRWLKKLLQRFKIAFTDDCCPVDNTSQPVRYNVTEDELQRYDPDTDTWVAVV